MATADDDIDRLYQLPLDEFTAARNQLAKQPGGSAAIKTLQKPNIAAWAVNQLYWHRRRDYDRVVDAATKVRDAHSRMLAGKSTDVRAAESDHTAAVKAATEAIRALLRDANEAESPATLSAVQDTLQALPGDEPPGRLVRPLKPKGFEALLGLVRPGAAIPRPKPTLVPPSKSPSDRPSKADLDARKRAAEARQREIAEAADAVREARAAARKATTAAEHARAAHTRAVDELRELQAQLAALQHKIRELAFTAKRLEKEAATAATTVERLELRKDHLNAGSS